MPLQPARIKSDREQPFYFDENIYSTDDYFGRSLAEVTLLGVGRDRRYAQLTYSPVRINPVSGKMIVCRSAEVTANFVGSDAGATLKHYERYQTPAFAPEPTINRLFTNAKAVSTTAPVRMVVLVPQALACTAIDDFVDWKRMQGMMVDVEYIANGTTASSITATLKQMYDNATNETPAPTYILLVGDDNRMPAFPSSLPVNNVMHEGYYMLDDHVTDLYYTTWSTDDLLPDCYQGRLSARDTTTLRGVIEKTIYYERYNFVDDSYLSRAILVAGVDNAYNTDYYDNAWRCADPSMDYVASYYINADNGFDSLVYYKNNINRHPEGVTVTGSSQTSSVSGVLRSLYDAGAGWINYSAHGDWNEWTRPSFTVSQINNMTNYDKPSFMIGNCCLSSHFDSQTCFAEALLRRSNRAGAVAYIGATNSTFWDHDFYWTVGVRSNIYNGMTLNYDATRRGMYDNLFHTHNEALSQRMVTAGKMVFSGNMSVNRIAGSSSDATSFVEYYWEIYELMGDPSLMPWLGRAADLEVVITKVDDVVTVNAAPGAYVAWVTEDDHRLLGAAYADAEGMAQFTIPVDSLATAFVSVTAQGYKPYIRSYRSHNVGIEAVTHPEVVVSPNPASGRCSVVADGLRRVVLLNTMGQTLQTLNVTSDHCILALDGIPTGLYLLRVETTEGLTIKKLIVK